MLHRTPRSTRTDPLLPYTTLLRAPRIDEGAILRSRDDHRAHRPVLLLHGELDIASAGRHVEHVRIGVAPFRVGEKLVERASHHGAAPGDGTEIGRASCRERG